MKKIAVYGKGGIGKSTVTSGEKMSLYAAKNIRQALFNPMP